MKLLSALPPLEDKEYGPDCSDEERSHLMSWVYLFDNETVILKPPPKTSAFTVNVFDEKLRELSANLKTFDLVIDLTSPHERPNAEIRDRIRKQVLEFGKIRRAVVVTGANWLANIAAQFIFNFQGMPSLTVHKTFEQALEVLGNGKRK